MVEAAVFVGLLTAALGYFLGAIWPFELFSHFRLQSIAALAVATLLMLFLRRRILAAVCLVSSLLLAVTLLPYYYPRVTRAPDAQLKLLSFNVNTANENFSGVRDYLAQQQADVVFLMEVNSRWVDELSDFKKTYPHQIIIPREDNFGIALLSKHPFVKEETLFFTEFDLPAVAFEISCQGTTYHIIGTHPLPPTNGFNFRARNAELNELGRRISHLAPSILMGDFNLTPFSPIFAELQTVSGLRDSSLGLGLHPTWMVHNPLIAVPIDHILISKDLVVSQRTIGSSLGSDHSALVLSVSPRK